ncbi:ribosomal protein S18-alanine N-acetyltransferase [Microbulbifer sp. TB1203]|uniref:ribosomal protein S18-alanine N-acetyltransferase n=1 Tax=unclassified Microbulbifer TaxID=2619833 RepID=UPI0035B40EC7
MPEPRPLRFRAMRADDIAAVHTNEILAYSHPWTQDVFNDCLTNGCSCLVAETDNKIVGHGIMSAPFGQARIFNLCIAPQWQGRGFGRLMVKHMLDVGRKYGAQVAFLEVRPSNITAIRLYKSIGFSEVGLRRNYYPAEDSREDAIVMVLTLTSGTTGFCTALRPRC